MPSKERVSIHIDGANFHHLVLKKLGISDLNFRFDDFADFLASERFIAVQCKRFCIGTVREKVGDLKSKEAMARQTKLFTILKYGGWEIKKSKLRVRTEKIIIDRRVADFQNILQRGIKEIEITRTREKGIDVKLATDLIVGAVDNKYDTAIIVSSDTDLVPAMDWIRARLKKKVEYIGFSIGGANPTQPSQGMIGHTDIQRVLIESDIRRFIQPTLFEK